MKNDYTVTAVTATSTGTTTLGFVGIHEPNGSVKAEQVIVEQTTAADASWNIELDGRDLFASEQSVTSADTPETFVPDQNRYASGDNVEMGLDISASGSGGNLNVTVTLDESSADSLNE